MILTPEGFFILCAGIPSIIAAWIITRKTIFAKIEEFAEDEYSNETLEELK